MNIFNYDHIENGSSNDTSIYDKERLTSINKTNRFANINRV